MHRYLMEVRKWFGGYETFVVEADGKSDALDKGKKILYTDWRYSHNNVDRLSLKVVKKLKPEK